MVVCAVEDVGESALAWNAQELLFGPCKEGRDFWLTQLLTRSIADVDWLAIHVALNIEEFAYPVERLTGDLGLV